MAAAITVVSSAAASAAGPAGVSITFKKLNSEQRQQLQAMATSTQVSGTGNSFKLVSSTGLDQLLLNHGGQP